LDAFIASFYMTAILCDDLQSARRFDKQNSHRRYVGGMWERIGRLQFNFLLSKGLKPEHYLLDIACGSLRLGQKIIPYLAPGHYLGIEKERGLIYAGLMREITEELREEKQPNIVISSCFEFEKLHQKADFSIAQSLFTHLPKDLIDLCFRNLRPILNDDGVFYATYRLAKEKVNQPRKEYGNFAYTREEMIDFGDSNGFVSNYIGDWSHPRNQVMVEYRKKH
jgi:SAM-dependent methyltransferase